MLLNRQHWSRRIHDKVRSPPPQNKKRKKLILQQREHNDRMGTMSKKEGICSHSMDVWVNACGFPPVQPPTLCDEVPLPGLSPLDWPLSHLSAFCSAKPSLKRGTREKCVYVLVLATLRLPKSAFY